MSNPSYSIFNCNNKLLSFSDNDFVAAQKAFSEDDLFEHYLIKDAGANGDIAAIDINGKLHTLFGPANGAVVCVKTKTSSKQNLDKLVALWENAGYASPATVEVSDFDSQDTAVEISRTFLTQLGAELHQVSEDAVKLDKQVALLREDLEDYRRSILELKLESRLRGNFPSLTFERDPGNSSIAIDSNQCKQLLPYAGNLMSAIAVHVPDFTANHSGTLVARLIAREDESELAEWKVDAWDMHGPWVHFSLLKRISTRYRFIDLVLEWEGSNETSPRLSLANAFGDEDGFLKLSGESQSNQMLAMRVWTGAQFDRHKANECIVFPAEVAKLNDDVLLRKIPENLITQVQGISNPKVDFKWVNTHQNDIFVHPTLPGPSIAQLPVHLPSPATGMHTRLSLEHENSKPVSFRIAAIDASTGNIKKYLKNCDAKPVGVLFDSGWNSIVGRSDKPLQVKFESPSSDFIVILQTRSDKDDTAYGHAWFRDLKVIMFSPNA